MQAAQAKPDAISSQTAKVCCDGDAQSAHPRVFLTMNAQGFVDCPYCGKHYVLAEGAHAEAH